MTPQSRQIRAFLLLGMVMVLWAGNSIVGRAVRFDVPPLTLAFIRWTGASLLLLPFAIGPLRRDWSAILAGWKPVLLLGALGVGAFNALLYSGLRETPATNALLLQAATPALVVAFDRIFFGVRSPLLQNLGVAASILGVAMIVFQGNLARAAALNFGGGDVLILGSVLVWSLYMVLLRWRPDISPISFVAATFFIGVLAMAPFAAWDWLSGNHIRWSVKVVGAFAYVAVLPSIVSYFIFNSAAHVLGPARAGQTITLMPIFGAFLSAALLGEDLHGYHFVGMALILSGIGLSILAMRQQTRAGPAVGSSLEERA